MSAIALSADGENIFLALENSSTFQVVIKIDKDDLSTGTTVYDPGAGTAANVVACVGNSDLMFFYGNFGSDVQILKHTVSTGAETNISPSGLATKICNTLFINPSNPLEIVASIDTDQDLKYTSDQGSNWINWDAALGFNATALFVLWSGDYGLNRYLVGGKVGVGNLDVKYSPNEGANSDNKENAGLAAQANICSIEVLES